MLKLTKLSVSKAACKYCFSIYIPPVTLQYVIKWRMCSIQPCKSTGGYITEFTAVLRRLGDLYKDTTTLSITSRNLESTLIPINRMDRLCYTANGILLSSENLIKLCSYTSKA